MNFRIGTPFAMSFAMQRFWVLFCSVIGLSSCFENIEEIRLKADGSGSFTYILNFSQSKGEISTAIKMDSFLGLNLPSIDEMKQKVHVVKQKLIASKGISNIVLKEDWTNYIIELSGNFTSIQQFNAAAKSISIAMGANADKINEGFSYQGSDSTFIRTIYSVWKPEVAAKLRNIMGQRMDASSYTLIVRNEKLAKTVTGVKSKISPSKKAVMVKLNGSDLINHTDYLNISILY